MEIAVVRALALGDMLCSVPALRSLRARFPDATITLIGLPWASELVRRYPVYLDGFLAFPGFPGIPEAPFDASRTVAFVADMQRHGWDLVVQLHGAGTSINEFVCLFGAKRVAGFVPPGTDPPTSRPRDVWVTYPSHGSEVDRLLELTAALGGPTDRWTEFPITESDLAAARALLSGHRDRPDRLAVVHPGGSDPERRWPAERFAAVADDLAASGFAVVLTGGADEAVLTARVASLMASAATDLGGRTTLPAAGALIELASLVVTNDTGISHLAAAVATDSVTVFSASDRERWAPVGRARHLAVGQPRVPRTCRHDAEGEGAHRCLGDACTLIERTHGPVAREDVSVSEVVDAVHALIDGSPARVIPTAP